LENDKFSIREDASQQLKQLARLAEPMLSARWNASPSLETKKRLELLLTAQTLFHLPSDELRKTRAVQILEVIASEGAKALLLALAQGHAEAWQTQQSQSACLRLGIRQKSEK
jgi:hypothetical protein